MDDSNLNESLSIEEYISNKKSDLNSGNIDLETYINKNDIDHEQIYKYLENILASDINKFFDIYKKHYFKLTLEQRILLQNKFKTVKNVTIPEFIKMNMINETNIENIFKKILSELIELTNISYEEINKIFTNNNVFFEKMIDIKVPYKYGTKELKFYSLLSDLFFYFSSTKCPIIDLYKVFKIMKLFIINMINDDELLILKCNYLINILYMYLESGNIDKNIFKEIVTTCIPFNEKYANNVLKNIKYELTDDDVILIDDIPITKYEGNLSGDEKIILQDKSKNIKIETFSKYVNWYIGSNLDTKFASEDFMLCLTFPENTKYNNFTMGEIGNSVDKFFNHMIHSKPMKQAMIVDEEACKYKYFFDNENILKEFKSNIHYVPLPFQNYFGFTDKKSFDIYINVSYKTNDNFVKILKKYNIFFITKSHEFKHASRIYLRLYDNKIRIKTPIKEIKKSTSKNRKYLFEIFNNTQKNLNHLCAVNNPEIAKKNKSKINEYGELLEFSLFGYKCDELFLKSIIFCLSESSWKLSPMEFYSKFSEKMLDNKIESINHLCKEPFLKSLIDHYSLSKKEKFYTNLMISKDSDISTKNIPNYMPIERKPHLGLKDINRGNTIEEMITVEDIKKMMEEEEEEEENLENKSDKQEDNENINEEDMENSNDD